jgi:hypothetical protein
MNRSGLGIVRTVHQAADAGMNERSRTHGARLNCSKQFTVAEAVVTEVPSGFAQRHDLSVGGWIVVGQVAIPASSDDAAITYDDGSYGDFAGLESALGGAESFFHPELVACEQVGAGIVTVMRFRIQSIRRLVRKGQLKSPAGQSPESQFAAQSGEFTRNRKVGNREFLRTGRSAIGRVGFGGGKFRS